uniref:(northern house mosquito) hypothetical protein n=1 Tax=Culex pipiens TaxID=7175 RepID=A0A8D8D2Y4_CULPI
MRSGGAGTDLAGRRRGCSLGSHHQTVLWRPSLPQPGRNGQNRQRHDRRDRFAVFLFCTSGRRRAEYQQALDGDAGLSGDRGVEQLRCGWLWPSGFRVIE